MKRHTRSNRRRSVRRRMRGGRLCASTPNNASNVYTVDKTKAGGSTWMVYDQLGDDRIIIKKIGPAEWLKPKSIRNELAMSQLASDLGVGPRVLFTKMCKKPSSDPTKPPKQIGYLVMEKIVGDLVDKLDPKPTGDQLAEITAERNRLLDVLYDNGVRTWDHEELENTMYGSTQSHPEPRVWLIDFDNVKQKKDAEGNPVPIPPAERKYT